MSRFIVFGGPKSGGKTTLSLRCIAAAQKEGTICAYVDLERSFDPKWAERQGINLKDLIIITGDTAEEALDAVLLLLDSKAVGLIVIDSVAAVAAKGEIEDKGGKHRDMSQDTMSLIAKKLSQFFRAGTSKNAKAKCATILIAQVRADIGSYGGFDKIQGGNALQHYNSLSLRVRRGPRADNPKDGDGNDIGFSMVIKIDKTKLANNENAEFRIPFVYGEGISVTRLAVNTAISNGTIKKSGGWYSFGDIKVQGYEQFLAALGERDIEALITQSKGTEPNEK